MKKIFSVMLVIIVVCLCFAGCGSSSKSNDGSNQNTVVSKLDTSNWKDYKIQVNGEVIEFGKTTPSDLNNGLGEFTQVSGLPFSKEYESNKGYMGNFKNLQNKFSYLAFCFYNISKEEVLPAEKCVIHDISVKRGKIEDLEDVSILLPGNLDFEKSKFGDFVEKYGEPDGSVENSDSYDGNSFYSWGELDTGSIGIVVNDNGDVLELMYGLFDLG